MRQLVQRSIAAAIILTAVGCATQKQASPTPAEQNPYETFRSIAASMRPVDASQSAQARCLAKQRARLEGCGARSGEDRVVCEAVANELINVCKEMNPEANAAIAGWLFCTGVCTSKPCPPGGCPTPAGPCLGVTCTAPGKVCNPGILWDCVCTNTVIGGPPISNTLFCGCSCS